jgi:hypothetical protein
LGLDSKGKVVSRNKARFTAPTTLCPACSLPVYPLEKAQVERLTYHKDCFVCAECNKKLMPNDFSKFDGKFYCNPHFHAVYMRSEESTRRVTRKCGPEDGMSPSSVSTASTDANVAAAS